MKANLLERRRKMLKLKSLGFSLSTVVNDLRKEYGVTRQAIYKDWGKRASWQPELLGLDDVKQTRLDIYANHQEIYRMAVKEYLTGDNSSARVGALRVLRDLNRDFLDMLPPVEQDRDKKVILSWDIRPYWFAKLTEEEREQLRKLERPLRERALKRFKGRENENKQSKGVLDVTQYSEEEREQLREAERLMKRKREEADNGTRVNGRG